MPRSAGYVDPETLKRTGVVLQDMKQRSYARLHVQAGSHVLDVGCGPGIDTVALGRLVGPTGKVVGLDLDEEMIAEADRFAKEAGVDAWVSHRHGDIESLPFANGTFDACRAERLFQVLPSTIDPQKVCAELVRVLKPGGWLVALDADWGTWSMDSVDVDLERKLARVFAEHLRPNGYAGRQFRRLFVRQGLVELSVDIIPIHFLQSSHAPFGGTWVHQAAVEAGIITPAEQERWRASVEQADARNEFFATTSMVMVAGQKPSGEMIGHTQGGEPAS